MEVLSF